MENEIKVGDWIRTNWGHIGKLKRIELDKNDKSLKWYVFDHKEFEINIIKEEYINKPYIVKHSPNLKDVIQKDDFVNGDRVVSIDYTEDENGNYVDVLGIMEIDDDYAYPIELRVINIREVVTKEQFESISYKVKQEEN